MSRAGIPLGVTVDDGNPTRTGAGHPKDYGRISIEQMAIARGRISRLYTGEESNGRAIF